MCPHPLLATICHVFKSKLLRVVLWVWGGADAGTCVIFRIDAWQAVPIASELLFRANIIAGAVLMNLVLLLEYHFLITSNWGGIGLPIAKSILLRSSHHDTEVWVFLRLLLSNGEVFVGLLIFIILLLDNALSYNIIINVFLFISLIIFFHYLVLNLI